MRRFVLIIAVLSLGAAGADQVAKQKESLSQLQTYIGDWSGVGQPRRGSARGAWREKSGWQWSFTEESATLVFKSDGAKYFQTGKLLAGDKPNSYALEVTTKDEQKLRYSGELDEDGKLVLTLAEAVKNLPARISIRQVAGGDRLVVLYEKQSAANRYSRLAEVGYTRKGSNFGKGTSFIECIVTGGVGTIQVSHGGKKYYVCCSGCLDYFNDDPAAAVEEYLTRKAEEKQKKKNS